MAGDTVVLVVEKTVFAEAAEDKVGMDKALAASYSAFYASIYTNYTFISPN